MLARWLISTSLACVCRCKLGLEMLGLRHPGEVHSRRHLLPHGDGHLLENAADSRPDLQRVDLAHP
jgi:hypothetical protein